MSRRTPCLSAFVLLLAAPGTAWAQAAAPQVAAPAPTREEINRIPTGPAPAAPSRLTVAGGIERAPCPLAEPRFAAVTVTVNDVVFDNLKVADPASLRPAWADYAGKTVPIAAVCEIRDAAATILRRQGFLAAVQVPAQRIENGVVHFDVLMAKLVAVQVRGRAGKSEALIAGYLQRLTQDEVFNEKSAARYLLLARDVPGYDVRLTLRPANAAPGEVVGEVTLTRTPLSVDANIQNYGSKDVGRIGGLLRAEAYDLLGFGDRLTLGYFATADFREQNVVQGSYDVRLGSEGLTLGGRATYAWTRPDTGATATSAGDVRANTFVAGAEIGFPFVRTEPATARGAVGFELINQNVTLPATLRNRDRIRVAYARLDFDTVDAASVRGGNGYSSGEPRWRYGGSIELRKGLDVFGASDSCGPAPYTRCLVAGYAAPTRIEGKPTATVARYTAIAEFRPIPKIAFVLQPRAQYSHRALLSYEEYSGGNYTVGRGYDPGAVIGDSGVGFQSEVRFGSATPKAVDAFAVQPYGFFDAAWVWNRNQPVAPFRPDPQRLFSAGGGARITYGDRARLDLTVAVPLQRAGLPFGTAPNQRQRRGDVRLLFSLTTKLVPWGRR